MGANIPGMHPEAGRSTGEWDDPFSCPIYQERAGYFPSYPDPVLSPCGHLKPIGLDQSTSEHVKGAGWR